MAAEKDYTTLRVIQRKSGLMNRPRDERGQFTNSSKLGHRFTVRLYRGDYDTLMEIAKNLGTTPTELLREIAKEWIEKQSKENENAV